VGLIEQRPSALSRMVVAEQDCGVHSRHGGDRSSDTVLLRIHTYLISASYMPKLNNAVMTGLSNADLQHWTRFIFASFSHSSLTIDS